MSPSVRETLMRGLAGLPFSVSPHQVARLESYLQCLGKWNAVHNLTSVRDPEAQVVRHVLDCLAVVPFIPQYAGVLLDVGSGAGLPALMVATVLDVRVIAVDSVQKKTAFIRQAAMAMGLRNVTVLTGRIEQIHEAMDTVDVVMSRAMASVDDFLALTAHIGHQRTLWMLMKARALETLTDTRFRLRSSDSVHVPLLAEERQVLLIERK